ncbi:MAG: DUF1573 domain-containing protein [Salinivirgaceae bacterium]|nr:DUF1573 domain-containing protein [Salinivirgaceae bacterium]
MKKAVVLFTLLMVFASCVNKNSTNKQNNGTPIIHFENTTHTFGNLLQGEVVNHAFVFRNIGNADLLITDVSASCGCTLAKYPEQPIHPGDSGKIEVEFNSIGREGRQIKTVNVWTNASDEKVTLKFFANIDTSK